jgi:hypothetical protein
MLATSLVTPAASPADGAAEPVAVRATATGLSIRAEHAPLEEVLREIAAETGMEVQGGLRSDPEVTVDFEAASFPEAFRRILGDQSFVLIYGSAGRPRAVPLLGSRARTWATGGGAGAAGARPDGDAPAADSSANAPPMPGSIHRHPVDGRLARALGSSTGSFNELIEIAAKTDDLALRRDALARGIGILDAEPELRGAILATVRQSSTDQLARYLVFAAGPRAGSVAAAIAEVVGEGEPRERANAVVRQIELMERR